MVAAQTTTNVFHFSNELEHFLGEMRLYDSREPCFFTFANAVYKHLRRNPASQEPEVKANLRIIASGVSCIADEGWQFSTWQRKERAAMIPALVSLYHRFDGRDWTRFRMAVGFDPNR